MSDSEDDTSAQGKSRGRTSSFITKVMKEVVVATYNVFEKEVLKRPLMTTAQEKELVDWKRKTINDILDAPTGPFIGCIIDGDDSRKRAAWYTVRCHRHVD